MSDNKKYYYLKLKEDFFDKDNMRIIETQPNGYIYSNIILKLYLRSLKGDGQLMMTDRIPYDPNKIDILAKVIGHDPDHVKQAIKLACDLDKMTIMDSGEMWMNDIQDYIGHSSTEADRKRRYRRKLEEKQQEMDKCPAIVPNNLDKNPLEKEKEREKKKKRKRNIEIKKNDCNSDELRVLKKYIREHFSEKSPKYFKTANDCKRENKAILNLANDISERCKTLDEQKDFFDEAAIAFLEICDNGIGKSYFLKDTVYIPSKMFSKGIWVEVIKAMNNKEPELPDYSSYYKSGKVM